MLGGLEATRFRFRLASTPSSCVSFPVSVPQSGIRTALEGAIWLVGIRYFRD